MAGTLPPAPINEPPGSFAWAEWYTQLSSLYSASGAIPWASINTTGSNITDIASRAHNNLQSIQGGVTGEYYHLPAVGGTFRGGNGAPSNGDGSNGDFYFRNDGGAGTTIYHKRAGAWVGVV